MAVRIINNIKGNHKITSKSAFKSFSEEFVKDMANDLSSNKAVGGEIPQQISRFFKII